jgi:hypothetical protein
VQNPGQVPSKTFHSLSETYCSDVLLYSLRNGFERIEHNLVFGIHVAIVTHFQNL